MMHLIKPHQVEGVIEMRDSVWDHSFIRVTKLTEIEQGADIICEHHNPCYESITHLVTICDAPELHDEPDEYLLCTHHANTSMGQWVLSYLENEA